jgi:hypothetical protein
MYQQETQVASKVTTILAVPTIFKNKTKSLILWTCCKQILMLGFEFYFYK